MQCIGKISVCVHALKDKCQVYQPIIVGHPYSIFAAACQIYEHANCEDLRHKEQNISYRLLES